MRRGGIMRRVPFLAALLAVVAAALVLGSAPSRTGAQNATPAAAGQGFVGAWRLATTTPFGASQSLITLSADGTVAATFVEFVADAEGNFVAIVTDSIELTLGADGDSWSGQFSSTTTDPSGTVLFVGGGTGQATRITVQPLATPPAGTPAA